MGGVFDALGDNIVSDIPSSEIKVMMRKYASLNRSNIKFIHLDGKWQSPYIYVNDEDVKKAGAELNMLLKPSVTDAKVSGTVSSAQ